MRLRPPPPSPARTVPVETARAAGRTGPHWPVLLTITTTHPPATDLGFLLHKNPARAQSTARVGRAPPTCSTRRRPSSAARPRCCSRSTRSRSSAAAAAAGRRRTGRRSASAQYVNDRPYAASSMLAVALGKVFSSARRGVSRERPELARTPDPARGRPAGAVLPGRRRDGRALLRARSAGRSRPRPVPLDESFPEWGDSRYVTVRLTGTLRVADALNHLYVALPVLDDGKHYWVSTDEIDKLLRAGAGWLADHPDRELITRRYLAHRGSLARQAIARLAEVDDTDPDALDDATAPARTARRPPAPRDDAPDARCRWSCSATARCSPRCARSAPGASSTSAAAPARCCRRCSPSRPSREVVGVDVSARALRGGRTPAAPGPHARAHARPAARCCRAR